jgi:uncharacterized repeat protein (TIGR01451 family)
LVDSGPWYYQSFADYYQASLTNLGYAYDYWPIKSPFGDNLPGAARLAAYDVVLWSSPYDSPGYVNANNVITDYLGTGGNVLVSGQSVAINDAYGFYYEYWFHQKLQGELVDKRLVTETITGAPGTLFEGLNFTLNGGSSANNQAEVDQTQPRRNALSEAAFYYPNGNAAGLQADQCRAYHLAYLGFGLEGVTTQTARDAILARTLAYFQTPDVTNGARWLPAQVDDFARPADQMVYPLTLQNLSETMTDTFSLQVGNAPWTAALSSPAITIGPCETAVITLTLTLPAQLPKDVVHEWQITAVSQNVPANAFTLPLRHKTPGYVLLVDDDRWYDQEAIYQSALAQIGLSYDFWSVGWDGNTRGSPPLALLKGYEMVIWFTGYDWFQPVTPAEREALTAYLAQGGRLFLNSQDFLYYHHQTALARDYLGVLAYAESITPTQVYAGHPILPSATAGPLPLTYDNFRNHGDGLIATAVAQPFLWHDQGMLGGIARSSLNAQPSGEARPYRAIFWAIPLEKTATSVQPALLAGVVGWLSDLGDSTFQVDQPVGSEGDTRVYTITVRNQPGAAPNQIALTNTLPALLLLQPDSLSGGATYQAASHTIHWVGELSPGGEQIITYRAMPQATAVGRLDNALTLRYARHPLPVQLTAPLWLDTPDLHASTLMAEATANRPIQSVTVTLALVNDGLVAAPVVTAVVRLPDSLTPLTSTLTVPTGSAMLADQRLTWHGSLAVGESVTLSVVLTRTRQIAPVWLTAVAYLDDGFSDPIIRAQVIHLPPHQYYLPVIALRP